MTTNRRQFYFSFHTKSFFKLTKCEGKREICRSGGMAITSCASLHPASFRIISHSQSVCYVCKQQYFPTSIFNHLVPEHKLEQKWVGKLLFWQQSQFRIVFHRPWFNCEGNAQNKCSDLLYTLLLRTVLYTHTLHTVFSSRMWMQCEVVFCFFLPNMAVGTLPLSPHSLQSDTKMQTDQARTLPFPLLSRIWFPSFQSSLDTHLRIFLQLAMSDQSWASMAVATFSSLHKLDLLETHPFRFKKTTAWSHHAYTSDHAKTAEILEQTISSLLGHFSQVPLLSWASPDYFLVVQTDKQKTLMLHKHQIDNTDVCLTNSVLATNPKHRI